MPIQKKTTTPSTTSPTTSSDYVDDVAEVDEDILDKVNVPETDDDDEKKEKKQEPVVSDYRCACRTSMPLIEWESKKPNSQGRKFLVCSKPGGKSYCYTWRWSDEVSPNQVCKCGVLAVKRKYHGKGASHRLVCARKKCGQFNLKKNKWEFIPKQEFALVFPKKEQKAE